MSSGRALPLGLVLALLAAWTWALAGRIELRTDLDFIMPRASTPALELLGETLQQGPGSGLILIALSGRPPVELARASDQLADRLAASGAFNFATSGRQRIPEGLAEAVFRYRYLLGPPIDEAAFAAPALRRDLEAALRRLATTAGMAGAGRLPADPTDRMGAIAAHLRGGNRGHLEHGVWFTPDSGKAIVAARSVTAGLDLDAARRTVRTIEEAVATLDGAEGLTAEMSGVSVFAVETSERIRDELQLLTVLSSVLVLGVLLFAFRSPVAVVVLALPLAIGILAAATAAHVAFGALHAIALTFGITLIGVTIDYPVHIAAHARPDVPLTVTTRRIWPTLALGALTTVAGFSPIALSKFPGLAQMGVFAIVGLVAAAGAARWLVPRVLPPDAAIGRVLVTPRWLTALDRLRAARLVVLGAALAGGAYIALEQHPLFDDDLGRLSPVPESDKAFDRALRAATGSADVRYLITVDGASVEAVLRRSEDLRPDLDALVDAGLLAGYDMAARYLPSVETQQRRQRALPSPADLKQALAQAADGLPFRADAFAPFVRDVAAAKAARPLTLEAARDEGFGWPVERLLTRSGDRWVGLVVPSGLTDPAGLAAAIEDRGDRRVRFLDLKRESNALVRDYREDALRLLAWGALAVLAVLIAGQRSLAASLRVVAPIVLAVVLTLEVLTISGRGLSLFQLLSLLLVTGIGLDYALFFNRHAVDAEQRIAVLRAVLVCTTTTVCVFAVLGTSQTPVLRGIGVTVAIGTVLCLLLTPVFAAKRVENE